MHWISILILRKYNIRADANNHTPLSAETLPPRHPFQRMINKIKRTSNTDAPTIAAIIITWFFLLWTTGGLKSVREEAIYFQSVNERDKFTVKGISTSTLTFSIKNWIGIWKFFLGLVTTNPCLHNWGKKKRPNISYY